MSKAFINEDNLSTEDDDQPIVDEFAPGQRNYITPRGYMRLEQEFQKLKSLERPRVVEAVAWAASNGDRSENADYIYGKRRLREIDRRLVQLTRKLAAAEIVDPLAKEGTDQVFFGATVTVINEEGEKKQYTIVGVDEVDAKVGLISYLSPLGKALLQTKVGDVAILKLPDHDQEIEVINIEFKSLP